jgi:hypothetical protein
LPRERKREREREREREIDREGICHYVSREGGRERDSTVDSTGVPSQPASQPAGLSALNWQAGRQAMRRAYLSMAIEEIRHESVDNHPIEALPYGPPCKCRQETLPRKG